MQPYRLLFPIGIIYALGGVFLWIALWAFGIPYPGVPHSNLMMSGFLLSFVAY